MKTLVFVLAFLSVPHFGMRAQDSTQLETQIGGLEKQLKNKQDRSLTLSLARLYFKKSEYDKTIKLYKSKFKKDACNPEELKIYGLARLKTYENSFITLKLIDRLMGDNLRHARIALNRASDRDSTDFEAKFFLGILQRVSGNNAAAANLLSKVFDHDHQFQTYVYSDVTSELTYTLTALGRFADIKKLQETIVSREPENAWSKIQLAIACAELGEDKQVMKFFYEGLDGITKAEDADRLFEDCRLVAVQQEQTAWSTLETVKEKIQFIKAFWKKRDTNPFDDINESLIQYYKRVHYAQTMYPRQGKPGYDDRGLIYIRYGRPDYIYSDPLLDLDRFPSNPRNNFNRLPNESWSYNNLEGGLHFDFVCSGGFYELRPLTEALPLATDNRSLSALFGSRFLLDPYYEMMAQMIAARGLSMSTIDADYLYREENDKAKNYAKKYFFNFTARGEPIYINSKYAEFRETNGETRLDFYYVIPFKQMRFLKSDLGQKIESDISVTMKILKYESYDEIVELQHPKHFSSDSAKIKAYSFVDEFRYTLKPGKYIVGLQVCNNDSQKQSVYQYEIQMRDYSADTLALSEIQFAAEIRTAESSTMQLSPTHAKDTLALNDSLFALDIRAADAGFVKPHTNILVIPNAAARHVKSSPLSIYYEIYGLELNENGRSSYEVSYTIKPVEQGKNIFQFVAGLFSKRQNSTVSLTSSKSGRETAEHEYIILDVSDLPAGAAQLEVKVKDLNSGKQTVSKSGLIIAEK